MKEQKRRNKVTIGLDLGDRRHRFCVLSRHGEVVEEGSLLNERAPLSALVDRYPAALVVMEAGCHSPWVSRYLEQLGCDVIVSNPRKMRAIYQHERKSDQHASRHNSPFDRRFISQAERHFQHIDLIRQVVAFLACALNIEPQHLRIARPRRRLRGIHGKRNVPHALLQINEL